MSPRWVVSKGVWKVHAPDGRVLIVKGGSRAEMEDRYPGCKLELQEVIKTKAV